MDSVTREKVMKVMRATAHSCGFKNAEVFGPSAEDSLRYHLSVQKMDTMSSNFGAYQTMSKTFLGEEFHMIMWNWEDLETY